MTIALLFASAAGVLAQQAVGKWRDHLSFDALYHVCDAGDRIYCSSGEGIFYYDRDDYTVNRVTKTTVLNDVGISTLAFDPHSGNLVVAYSNANLDIIHSDHATNISDIKRSNIGGNKKINSIRFSGGNAYLACGFGVVVIDLKRSEIKETYYIGTDGSYINVNDIAFTDSLIVAATDNGLMYADKGSSLLNMASNWHRDESSLIAGSRVARLEVDAAGHLLAMVFNDGSDTAVYRENSGMAFYPWVNGNIRNIKRSNGRILVCRSERVDVYDENYLLERQVGETGWLAMDPNDALYTSDGKLWVAHRWAALEMIDLNGQSDPVMLKPSCPASDNVFRLTAYDNNLMVSPGGHGTTYTNAYLPSSVYFTDGFEWKTLGDPDGLLQNTFDIIDVAVNPRNRKQRLAAAWGCGIVEITDGKVTNLYDETNTGGVLAPYVQGGFRSLRTGGVAYDSKGNAWITNSLTSNVLCVRYSNGTWKSFNTQGMVTNNDVDHIIWDSINDLKLFWGHANRVYVMDGEGRMAYIDPNNGAKLETSMINSLVQDHSGNIWMGTNKGIKVIYNLSQVFQNGGNGERSPVTCNNILFSQNGITEYLMAYESVSCIVVDGANRKWVGTSTGGLYLLSASGLEELEHFTSADSPLFSDKIVALSIMPWSGELYVGTDHGLQSYRTTATFAYAEPMDDIHAFPNPVRPDYEGLIAIKGFTRNGLVHITDAAGNVVYSTRANGGQAVWNGCTNSGERVASGVYYVFASAADGTMRSVTKILIIR